jgi:hypothetical protein
MAALSSRISGKSYLGVLGKGYWEMLVLFCNSQCQKANHHHIFARFRQKVRSFKPLIRSPKRSKKYKTPETNLRQIHQAPVSPLCRLPSAKELNSWERDWILASAERTALNLGGRWWQVFGFWMWFVGWPPCGSWHSDHSG